MATKTFIERHETSLIRKFHALLGKAGVSNEDKLVLLSSYGVESSKDLNVYELTELCSKLDAMSNPQVADLNLWRKRLMACIGGYLRAMNKPQNAEIIKGIACRAAKIERFNNIPLERLKSLYNAFLDHKKDLESVTKLTEEILLNN